MPEPSRRAPSARTSSSAPSTPSAGPLVIKFRDGIGIPYTETTAPKIAGGADLPGWSRLILAFPGLRLVPRFRAVSALYPACRCLWPECWANV